MSITSKIQNVPAVEEKPYPKLMQYDADNSKFIVLFKSKSDGMVICQNGGPYPEGYILRSWDHNQFIDFNGEIVLKNR